MAIIPVTFVALWSQILRGIYFPNGNLWRAKKGQRPSWGWQSILMGWDAIEPDIRWTVGDGKSINIRQDHWLSQGVLGGPENREEPQMVAELIDEEKREWKEPVLNHFFERRIVNEILSIPITMQTKPDQLIWTGNNTGNYTVKSEYYKVYDNSNQQDRNRASTSYQPPRTLWTKLWHLSIPPKLKVF